MAKTVRRVLTVIACGLGGAAAWALVLSVPWHLRWIPVACILSLLLLGLWTWRRGWRGMREERRDRQRRWGIRRNACHDQSDRQRRSVDPYMTILEDFIEERIDALEFRTRTIRQYDKADGGVNWILEWSEEVSDVLERMDADAEVYYPECPDQSLITLDELKESSRQNLQRLRAATALRERHAQRQPRPEPPPDAP